MSIVKRMKENIKATGCVLMFDYSWIHLPLLITLHRAALTFSHFT